MADFKLPAAHIESILKRITQNTNAKEVISKVRSDDFSKSLENYISVSSSMTEYTSVPPILLCIFSRCIYEHKEAEQSAKRLSNQNLEANKTIWYLLLEGKGETLVQKLSTNADFKKMIKSCISETKFDLYFRQLLWLIKKVKPDTFSDKIYSSIISGVITNMSGQSNISYARISRALANEPSPIMVDEMTKIISKNPDFKKFVKKLPKNKQGYHFKLDKSNQALARGIRHYIASDPKLMQKIGNALSPSLPQTKVGSSTLADVASRTIKYPPQLRSIKATPSLAQSKPKGAITAFSPPSLSSFINSIRSTKQEKKLESKGDAQPPSEAQIRFDRLYEELFRKITYDAEYGKKLQEESESMPVDEQFRFDLEAIKETNRGTCRQISTLMCFELDKIGIPSRIIVMETKAGGSHSAVLYELDRHLFVADLTSDITPNKASYPHWRRIPIVVYMQCMVHIKDFYVVTKHPKDIRSDNEFHIVLLSEYAGRSSLG